MRPPGAAQATARTAANTACRDEEEFTVMRVSIVACNFISIRGSSDNFSHKVKCLL